MRETLLASGLVLLEAEPPPAPPAPVYIAHCIGCGKGTEHANVMFGAVIPDRFWERPACRCGEFFVCNECWHERPEVHHQCPRCGCMEFLC